MTEVARHSAGTSALCYYSRVQTCPF